MRILFLLNFTCLFHAGDWEPDVTTQTPYVEAIIRQNVTMACSGKHAFKPFALTFWRLNGTELQWTNTPKYTFSEIFSDTGVNTTVRTSIAIRNVSAQDEGMYDCYLVTQYGSHNKQIQLTVKHEGMLIW